MKAFTRVLVTAVAAALLTTAAPAGASGPGSIVVVGNAGLFSCPPGSGEVVIQGQNDVGNHWTFSFEYANASQIGCLNAGAGVASGTWNPASGGAVAGLGLGQVSIGAVPSALTPTPVSIQVCLPAPCYTGSGIAFRL